MAHELSVLRVAARAERDPERTRAAVAQEVLMLVRTLRSACPRRRRLRNLLPRCPARRRLVRTLALIHGRQNRQAEERPRAGCVDHKALAVVNGAIRLGLFGDAVPPQRTVQRRELCAPMLRLERRHPDRFRAVPPVQRDRTARELSEDVVARMMDAADRMRAKFRAVLLLLYTTASRAGAIHRLRLEDVWDGRAVRRTVTLSEKFSVAPTVTLADRTRQAVEDYVQNERDPRCAFLFGARARPSQRPTRLCQTVMRAVARLAHVPYFHPHQWRRYMTHLFVTHDLGLDRCSKFLGHRSLGVTYRAYWRPDTEHLAEAVPFFRDDADATAPRRLRARIAALEAENQRLRTPAVAPPPPVMPFPSATVLDEHEDLLDPFALLGRRA